MREVIAHLNEKRVDDGENERRSARNQNRT